jgi:undecaprenyl-diphosphatase
MRRAELEALTLGLLHGPAELVPVSSSGHVAAVPWLLRWEVAGWDGARRKELEVALHAGTAAALLAVLRPRRVRPLLQAAAFAPPAAVGFLFERRIEQRLGTPPTLAGGLLIGAVALVLADRREGARADRDAGPVDGLALGLAQTAALMPGVSRSGATLAAARTRGFDRASASRLSWEVALPIVAGASALKVWRVVATLRSAAASPPESRAAPSADAPGSYRAAGAPGPAATADSSGSSGAAGPPASPGGRVRPLALGAAAAFVSTLATARAIGIERRGPLWPWAAWRAALAGAILAVRHNRSR